MEIIDQEFIESVYYELLSSLTATQELEYYLSTEQEELTDAAASLKKQALHCWRALAAVSNYHEIVNYEKGRFESREFDLSETVQGIVDLAKKKCGMDYVTIEAKIEKGICGFTDPERFTFCLINLIVNSLQNVDLEEGQITVTLKSNGDTARISVVDNGYSMTGEELQESLEKGGATGFGILSRFCSCAGTLPAFSTEEYGGFTVSFNVPRIIDHGKIGFASPFAQKRRREYMTPYSAPFFKLDTAEPVF